MSKFIRNIGNCAVNGVSFGVYENKNGTATVRPCSNGHELPRKKWIKFESIQDLEDSIDNLVGEDVLGASRVYKLCRLWLQSEAEQAEDDIRLYSRLQY